MGYFWLFCLVFNISKAIFYLGMTRKKNKERDKRLFGSSKRYPE
jgi:hypothetical protein